MHTVNTVSHNPRTFLKFVELIGKPGKVCKKKELHSEEEAAGETSLFMLEMKLSEWIISVKKDMLD